MESLPFLGFRVLGVDTKNSNPKFTGKYQVFHYTFLFNAYINTKKDMPTNCDFYSTNLSALP